MRSSDGMTIGVLARKSGVAVRTLRFYEERGLIAPLGRTAKGYRLYGPNVLEDLAFLKGARHHSRREEADATRKRRTPDWARPEPLPLRLRLCRLYGSEGVGPLSSATARGSSTCPV